MPHRGVAAAARYGASDAVYAAMAIRSSFVRFFTTGIISSVHTPVILAGGLGPQNVAEAIRTVGPAGVDSKTHTDQDSGPCKDIEQVRAFVRIAKSLRLDRGSSP